METAKRPRFYSIDKKKSPTVRKRNKTPDRESKMYSYKDLSIIESFKDLFKSDPNIKPSDEALEREVRESIKSIKNISEIITPFKYTGEDLEDNSIIYSGDYSFLSSYFKFKHNNFPEFFRFNLQVRVTNHILKDNIFQYVKYVMEGFINKKEFFIERRYKEFLSYRKLLCQNFPGLFVPPIPPKQSFGNLEEGFIKLRKKFIQHFFNRINSAPHLSSSYATKIFLDSRDKDFLAIPLEIYYKTPQCIYEFYEDYFKFLEKNEITSLHKKYVKDFYMKLNKTRDNLENFLYIAAEAVNINLETEKEMEDFYENLYDLDNNYIYDMFKLDKDTRTKFNKDLIECQFTETLYATKYENSNSIAYEWANVELIDTEAMIEAIASLFKYQEMFEKKRKILWKENKELEGLLSPSWFYKFFFPTNLKYLQSKTETVEILKMEVETLKKLIDLLYKILYYLEIPIFRKDKLNFYRTFLIKLLETECNSNEKNKTLFSFFKDHYTGAHDLNKNS